MLAKVLLITVLYGAICLYEIPHLLNKKYHREMLIFLVFLFPAYILSLLLVIGVNLPRIIPAIAKYIMGIP